MAVNIKTSGRDRTMVSKLNVDEAMDRIGIDGFSSHESSVARW